MNDPMLPLTFDFEPIDADREALAREQFAQVNASAALEGLVPDAFDLAIQGDLASGVLTPDEAVARYLARSKASAP